MTQKLIVFAKSEFFFWEHEFQAIIYKPEETDLDRILEIIYSGIRPIVQLNGSPSDFELLDRLPRKSILVHLNSDETYNPKFNKKVIKSSSVAAILRSYPLPNMKPILILKGILILTLYVLKSFFSKNFLSRFSVVIHGIVMAKRQIHIKFWEVLRKKITIKVPLGYTDLFYENFQQQFHSVTSKSLFSGNENLFKEKKQGVVFIGLKGNIFRQEVINACLEVIPDSYSYVKIRKAFGGFIGPHGSNEKEGREYFDVLRKSSLSICPPGNYSGITFRFAESIACRVLPVSFNFVPSDPLFSKRSSLNLNFMSTLNLKKTFSYIARLEEEAIFNFFELEKASFLKNLFDAETRIQSEILSN